MPIPRLMWDASAMAKNYAPEHGTSSVHQILQLAAGMEMVFTLTGYAETYSILRRKLNSGSLNQSDYSLARTSLRLDVIESLIYEFLPLENYIFSSLPIIDRHNLNSTDAAILSAYLDEVRLSGETCALVASDHRLLRAAQAEGLPVVNPEVLLPQDVAAYLASL